MKHIIPVVEQAMSKAAETAGQTLRLEDLDAIGFTRSPGLIGSLLVGGQFAKSLALSLRKPLIAVHHMQAHVIANLASDPKPAFPFLCLTVSGGHTQIVLCESPLEMKVIGETIDDAAGEAFDKSAKLLGLPYPGGPLIDKYAKNGNPERFRFPEPQVAGLDFSFSGLKTSILYFLQNAGKSNFYHADAIATEEERNVFIIENLPDICASIQQRIISILLNKLKKAVIQTGVSEVCLAGGVSANTGLRKAFLEMGKKNGWNCFIPAFEYCTDNAAMIALMAFYKYQAGEFADMGVESSARAEW